MLWWSMAGATDSTLLQGKTAETPELTVLLTWGLQYAGYLMHFYHCFQSTMNATPLQIKENFLRKVVSHNFVGKHDVGF